MSFYLKKIIYFFAGKSLCSDCFSIFLIFLIIACALHYFYHKDPFKRIPICDVVDISVNPNQVRGEKGNRTLTHNTRIRLQDKKRLSALLAVFQDFSRPHFCLAIYVNFTAFFQAMDCSWADRLFPRLWNLLTLSGFALLPHAGPLATAFGERGWLNEFATPDIS